MTLRPRAGEVVAEGKGVAEALRSRPRVSVAGDAGALPMWTAVGGAAVRVLVADGACDSSPPLALRRFPPVACWVGNADGLREHDTSPACGSMAAREGKGEDAVVTERSGTGSATMQSR